MPALVVYALAWIPFLLVGEPSELVRLQLAGSEAVAREIVSGWSPALAVDMAYLQGVDNVHLLAYGLLLATGAVWAGRRLAGRAARWARVATWMAAATALFDAVENAGMIAMMRGHWDAPVPAITTTFSIAKYATFAVVLLYVAAGAVGHRRRG